MLCQVARIELGFEIVAGEFEQARIRAAKAVDRLLGVTYHEYARRAPGVDRGIEPAFDDLPLQGIGVLKLVEQNVAIARIQLVLHIGGVVALGEQGARAVFDVGEVEHAARVLERLIMMQQVLAADQHIAIEAQRGLFGALGLGFIQTLYDAFIQVQEFFGILRAEIFAQGLAGFARTWRAVEREKNRD